AVGAGDLPELAELVFLPEGVRGVDRKRGAGDADRDVHLRRLRAVDVPERVQVVVRQTQRRILAQLQRSEIEDLLVPTLERVEPRQVPGCGRRLGGPAARLCAGRRGGRQTADRAEKPASRLTVSHAQ